MNMETATVFTVAFANEIPVGALFVSVRPANDSEGVKQKKVIKLLPLILLNCTCKLESIR